jgi:predicted TIM-barrel fold metal-dependent hydrolase
MSLFNDSETNTQEIWDSHVHILPPDRHKRLVRRLGTESYLEDLTPVEMLDEIKKCGVIKVFNLVFPLQEEETESINIWSKEIGEKFHNVIPFGSMHIETQRKDEVAERCLFEYGLAGLKFHPHAQGFEFFSQPFESLFRKLDELKRPVIVHTGFDALYGRSTDLEYLRGVLERYPGMVITLAHSLFPKFKLVYEMMGDYPHLYTDMTYVIPLMKYFKEASQPDLKDFPEDPEEVLANIDYFDALLEDYSERIMLGTDYPVGFGSPSQIYEDLFAFGFSDDIMANLLGNAARRFIEGG